MPSNPRSPCRIIIWKTSKTSEQIPACTNELAVSVSSVGGKALGSLRSVMKQFGEAHSVAQVLMLLPKRDESLLGDS